MLKKRVASRVFQDLTVPEIVARVLDVAGVPNTWKLAHSYAKRAYCVQYRESISRSSRGSPQKKAFSIIRAALRPARGCPPAAPPRPSALPRAPWIDGRRLGEHRRRGGRARLVEKVAFSDDPQGYPRSPTAMGSTSRPTSA